MADMKQGQTKTELSEDDIKLNRQINFLVMRKMWQTIRGRNPRGTKEPQTIYTDFRMSRERYTRAINGERIRITADELRKLVAQTGLSREIFQGETCFQFKNISRRDWEKLFILRGENIKKSRVFENNIYTQMEKDDVDIINNPDFYRFAVYLKHGKPVSNLTLEESIQEEIGRLQKIDVDYIEQCNNDVLQVYAAELKKQLDLVTTIIHYKELKRTVKM